MKDSTNWSKLQKETSAEFVDKLLLYVRTNNFEAFCFAVERGMWYYGQDKLAHLMHDKLLKKIYECGELDSFLLWKDKFNDL
jgi:hypothetical protein|tara:strand:+ start:131 stop:376 length:246 start_codon:yes stop_codon:yes gene_type:complete